MIRADNTQRRLFEGRLVDAIARDRAAMSEDEVEASSVDQTELDDDEQPWQLWLAIAVGSLLIIAAAFI